MPQPFHLRSRFRAPTLLLALSAVAPSVRAVEVPEAAITPDTALVVWVDVRAVDQFCEGLPSWWAGMPDRKKAKAEAFLQVIMKHQQAFKAWGGEGGLFIVVVKADPKSGTAEDTFILLKAKGGADPAALEKELHVMAAEIEQPDLKKNLSSAKVAPYGADGRWHAVTGPSLPLPPQNGSAKEAAVFNAALKSVEKEPVQWHLRALPAMTAKPASSGSVSQKEKDAGGVQFGFDLSDESMGKFESATGSVDFAKDAEQVGVAMHFEDAAGAAEFAASANGMLQMGKGMAVMQTAKWAKHGVDARNVNAILDQVVFKADQNDAAMKLDKAFFGRCRTLVQQMQAAQEKMKLAHPPAAVQGKKTAE